MQIEPSFWGSVFSGSHDWRLHLQAGNLRYSRTGQSDLGLPLPAILFAQAKLGEVWAQITIRSADTEIICDGVSNAQAEEFVLALRAAISQSLRTALRTHATPLLEISTRLQQLLEAPRYLARHDLACFRASMSRKQKRAMTQAQGLLQHPLLPPDGDHDALGAQLAVLAAINGGQSDVIEQRNRRFVAAEMRRQKDFFDTVESSPLSKEQRLACVTMEDRNLLLAAAGSGKTSTIIGKIGYALRTQQFAAAEILVLAFNADAARELDERIHRQLGGLLPTGATVTTRTFHALGLAILSSATGRRPAIRQAASVEEEDRAITQIVAQLCAADEVFAADWTAYCEAFKQGGNAADPGDAITVLRSALRHARMHDQNEKTLRRRSAKSPEAQRFMRLLQPLRKAWEQRRRTSAEIDFDDMIQYASAALQNGDYRHPYRLILVDEFQDMSPDRADLLKAMMQQAPACKLFAVGDDWQSIYRFAGSNIELLTRFERHFGATASGFLTRTYRCNQGISDVAARFVQKNPAQLQKRVRASDSRSGEVITMREYEHPANLVAACEASLEEIASQHRATGPSSVFLLARYHHHKPSRLTRWQEQFPGLSISFSTIHAAKGLEADHVIVLGLQEGRHGFPAADTDHPLLQLLRPKPENYPHAEERRLFYVALTRARHQVHLLADRQRPSIFYTELITDKRLRNTLRLAAETADLATQQ